MVGILVWVRDWLNQSQKHKAETTQVISYQVQVIFNIFLSICAAYVSPPYKIYIYVCIYINVFWNLLSLLSFRQQQRICVCIFSRYFAFSPTNFIRSECTLACTIALSIFSYALVFFLNCECGCFCSCFTRCVSQRSNGDN